MLYYMLLIIFCKEICKNICIHIYPYLLVYCFCDFVRVKAILSWSFYFFRLDWILLVLHICLLHYIVDLQWNQSYLQYFSFDQMTVCGQSFDGEWCNRFMHIKFKTCKVLDAQARYCTSGYVTLKRLCVRLQHGVKK